MQNETWTFLVLCFVMVEFRSMFATLERTCSPLTINRGPDPRGICDRKIDETVKLLCGTFGYNAKRKRDAFQHKGDFQLVYKQGCKCTVHIMYWDYSRDQSYEDLQPEQIFSTDFLVLQGILIGKEEAHSYLVKRSNFYQQGIACECCYHRCRIVEILQHCYDGLGVPRFKRAITYRKNVYADQIGDI